MNGIKKAEIQVARGTRPIVDELDAIRLACGFDKVHVLTPIVETRLRSGLLPPKPLKVAVTLLDKIYINSSRGVHRNQSHLFSICVELEYRIGYPRLPISVEIIATSYPFPAATRIENPSITLYEATPDSSCNGLESSIQTIGGVSSALHRHQEICSGGTMENAGIQPSSNIDVSGPACTTLGCMMDHLLTVLLLLNNKKSSLAESVASAGVIGSGADDTTPTHTAIENDNDIAVSVVAESEASKGTHRRQLSVTIRGYDGSSLLRFLRQSIQAYCDALDSSSGSLTADTANPTIHIDRNPSGVNVSAADDTAVTQEYVAELVTEMEDSGADVAASEEVDDNHDDRAASEEVDDNHDDRAAAGVAVAVEALHISATIEVPVTGFPQNEGLATEVWCSGAAAASKGSSTIPVPPSSGALAERAPQPPAMDTVHSVDPQDVTYLCRACRASLFCFVDLHSHSVAQARQKLAIQTTVIALQTQQLASHSSGVASSCSGIDSGAFQCTAFFLEEAPTWLALHSYNQDPNPASGGSTGRREHGGVGGGGASQKITCFKCSARLGNWSWSGQRCGCGCWVAPAFQFTCSKLDCKVLPGGTAQS